MKYQKSMLKIMENLLLDRKSKSIAQIIRETGTGRNSAFSAINWLENRGIVKIENSGRQRLVSPIIDNYTLQFKYYLDSLAFKNLDSFVKLIAGLFVSEIRKNDKVKGIVLFGSSLKGKNFNDIDFLLLGDLNIEFMNSLSKIRDKIERTFGVILNLHKDKLGVDNLLRGLVIYQSSYLELDSKAKLQFLEYIDWIFELTKNKKGEISKSYFNKAILNLAYAYCYILGFSPSTKSEALQLFKEKYTIKNLTELKKAGVKIGKEIFK